MSLIKKGGKMKTSFLFTMLLFPIFGYKNLANATDYYMSPSGNDANPGTLSKPWKTLDRLKTAQAILQPGDTVYFRGGNYLINDASKKGTYALSKAGTSSKRITYKKYSNEVPVILYDRRTIDQSKGHLVAMYPGNYTTFDGLTFRQTEASRCLALEKDCVSRGLTSSAKARYYAKAVRAMVVSGSDVIIRNCVVDNFSSVGMSFPGANVIVEYSTFKNISNHSWYLQGANGIYRNNTIDGSRQIPKGGSIFGIQIQYQTTRSNKIYGNLIKNTAASAVVFSGKTSYNEVFNNVLINPGMKLDAGKAVSVWCEDGPMGAGNKFYNNTVIGKSLGGIFGDVLTDKCLGVRPISKVEIRNNIFYPSTPVKTDLFQNYSNVANNIFYNISVSAPTGNRLVNPSLVNPLGLTAASAMLKAGSPAYDAGRGTVFPKTDYSGRARPRGRTFDIGAFEY
ncbi:MAG: hypothetical protein A4S09_16105 [Proteobacteria bacterium SG_bin7]|nr:MAG: hypothetical protein A4S09_16105 [Proteobacteria bacterium SG_bin7]